MNGFFAGLQSLIITVRRNGLSAVLTTALLLTLIFAWSIRGNVVTFIERHPSPSQEALRFDRSVEVDANINESLNIVRNTINADRVIIRQFHNSKTDLTGLPFTNVSATYFSAAPGISMGDVFQTYPLSSVNSILLKMYNHQDKPKCSKIYTSDLKRMYVNETIDTRAIGVGETVIYACPMFNLKNQPVGFITASYLTDEKTRPSDEEIMLILDDIADHVVGYVSQVVAPEKKPWYETVFEFNDK